MLNSKNGHFYHSGYRLR
jgi:hypothetical protein